MRLIVLATALALAGPISTLAQDGQEARATPPRPRLILTGRATLEATPDFASVSIGVTNKASTTAAALDATSAAAAKIVAAAKAFGISPRDLQTGYVSLQPAYKNVRDGSGSSEQRPDGYTASSTVTIRVRELARLGEFLRVVVDGGANQIGGIAFGLAEPGKLEREALAAAVKDARVQAETIAEAAGVKLGSVQTIRYGSGGDGSSYVPRRARAYGTAGGVPPPVPVEAGSLDVSAEVEVVFGIAER